VHQSSVFPPTLFRARNVFRGFPSPPHFSPLFARLWRPLPRAPCAQLPLAALLPSLWLAESGPWHRRAVDLVGCARAQPTSDRRRPRPPTPSTQPRPRTTLLATPRLLPTPAATTKRPGPPLAPAADQARRPVSTLTSSAATKRAGPAFGSAPAHRWPQPPRPSAPSRAHSDRGRRHQAPGPSLHLRSACRRPGPPRPSAPVLPTAGAPIRRSIANRAADLGRCSSLVGLSSPAPARPTPLFAPPTSAPEIPCLCLWHIKLYPRCAFGVPGRDHLVR
jgi:hypothetical protein